MGIVGVLAVAAVVFTAASVYFYFQIQRTHRRVQQELLAFSALEVESALDPADLAPSLDKILEKLMELIKADRAAIIISERWNSVLPSVQRGFSPDFLPDLTSGGAGDLLGNLVFRRGGSAVFRHLNQDLAQHPPGEEERALRLRLVMERSRVRSLTAVSLQTRERNFGVLLLPYALRRGITTTPRQLLLGMATQISLTLDNYALMNRAQRRTKEYELLTEVGQVVSSHLDPDEVLRAIHRELGQLFDTSTFYVAFLEGDELRFEFEVDEGQVMPKRSRKVMSGISEYIIRTGQSLLISSEMEAARTRLGAASVGRSARCFCGVPIFRFSRPVGIMAAMHYDREHVYSKRDLEVMETAAGQVAVAMENARLFAQEQQRARYLDFLNNISKTAISSQDAEQMLAEIVAEIQKHFKFDHIGIGILDYATKDIEIKAEAGSTAQALGKRVPLGTGILGRVARTNEIALVQGDGSEPHLVGILPGAKSVLCLPLTYGETLLGVLNLESQRSSAFAPQEVLTLRTLADLLATALHNAFVYQKVQQQSITDGLTGIKTRRFFMESVQAEWKRASRSGRAFSVVLVDLDKFKEVNDTMGHLEGDLVLARIGRLLEQKCRQSNVVARYGGDEFVVLMPETGVEQAQVLSERLRLWIATDPMLNERHITGSFGVATYPLHGTTVEDIIRVADAGMYVSKHAGGNRVSTAEEFAEGETSVRQRQLVNAYVEGFLQKEHTGPESAEELVSTLKRLGSDVHEVGGEEGLRAAVRTLTRAAETREVCAGHGDSVAKIAEIIAHELLMTDEEIADLVFAARVHDVGKIIIPERILNKAGPLTPDEYGLVKQHAAVGAEIVEAIPGGEHIRDIVRHHHERFDGTGYPDGLRGEKIPLGSRIIAVAEAYVDMTTERPYADMRSQADATAELEKLSGMQFDGMLVRLLTRQLKGERAVKTGGSAG
jgi:diguanylate cyclase (GGDEF)-like protein